MANKTLPAITLTDEAANVLIRDAEAAARDNADNL